MTNHAVLLREVSTEVRRTASGMSGSRHYELFTTMDKLDGIIRRMEHPISDAPRQAAAVVQCGACGGKGKSRKGARWSRCARCKGTGEE